MNLETKNLSSKKGFTLIELSIVLVIIGLIVGGVLVGQDLISAAEVRAQMSQIEKTNTAVNTFRVKYNGIPGDLSNAATFGMVAAGSSRDGDGLIEAEEGVQCGETLVFWRDLSFANLLEGAAMDTAIDHTGGNCHSGAMTVSDFLPEGKIGGRVMVYSENGLNYYEVMGVDTMVQADGTITTSPAFKNIDAYNIDQKLDDGVPSTGQVLAMEDGDSVSVDATNGTCRLDANTYDIATSNATAVECGLQFRAQF